MPAPRLPVRLRRRAVREVRWLVSNARSPQASFGHGCDIRSGLRLVIEGNGSVRVGANCVLDEGLVLSAVRGSIEVGDGTIFGHHCTIAAVDSLVIGRQCLVGEFVSIRDHDHAFARPDVAMVEQGPSAAPVRIGDDVWIGAKATVVKGVRIGDHAVIGAGAVVTADVPAYAVAVGVPARVVRRRDGAT